MSERIWEAADDHHWDYPDEAFVYVPAEREHLRGKRPQSMYAAQAADYLNALEAKAEVFDRYCAWAAWRRENGGFDDTDQEFLDLSAAIEAGQEVTIPRHWVRTDEESRAHFKSLS